ncbi:MAG TPA: hypothetical protein VHO06_11205 [Polyangia bacterium]|nr:hypothetical protein [Polyangia bacterium]
MRPAHQLTADEQENVRFALRYLYGRLGTWVAVARVTHLKRRTVRRVRDGWKVRQYVAVNVGMALGVSAEAVMTARAVPEGTCRHCGAIAEKTR